MKATLGVRAMGNPSRCGAMDALHRSSSSPMPWKKGLTSRLAITCTWMCCCGEFMEEGMNEDRIPARKYPIKCRLAAIPTSTPAPRVRSRHNVLVSFAGHSLAALGAEPFLGADSPPDSCILRERERERERV
jgi:hypothetical protein